MRIMLNRDQFEAFGRAQGWTGPDGTFSVAAAARAIGCHKSTLSRPLNGQKSAGDGLIGLLVTATVDGGSSGPIDGFPSYGAAFDALFRIETDERRVAA